MKLYLAVVVICSIAVSVSCKRTGPVALAKSNAVRTYAPTGEIDSYEERTGGVRDGWLLVFWTKSAAWRSGPPVMSAFHFKNGVCDGSFFQWDTTGALLSAGSCQSGQLVHGWVMVPIGTASVVPLGTQPTSLFLRFRDQDAAYRGKQYRNGNVISGPGDVGLDCNAVLNYATNDPVLSKDIVHVQQLAKELWR